ncbi:MAG TPA: 4'-phosphopantetheinyl transferase superfamily protein [Chitinophagales bacterium]|nr:4'-phosphopantetheinyl transferase superfamily protein [Chitinophagales bacterium]
MAIITILYCNINKILDDKIIEYLKILPEFMRVDVNRYINISDQKSRLLARLMLQKSMENTEKINLVNGWERDQNNKPFIVGWHSFNISHSVEMVVFAYGSNNIGIDIEKKVKLDFKEIMRNFHPEEQEYINNSEHIQKTFYDIWVKKEAMLKAIGIGIINGLKEFSCINESVSYKGNDWHFHSFSIHSDYISYVCSLNKGDEIIVTEFIPTPLFP